MKTLNVMKGLVLAAATIGMAHTASAVELRNFDQQNHTLKITSPTLDKEYEFRAWTRSLVICVDVCTFTLPDGSSIEATRDDIVSIEDGKLTMIPVTSQRESKATPPKTPES